MSWRRSFVSLVTSALMISGAALPTVSAELKFKRTVLDEKFRSEGVAVGDFNKDGKQDIAAGERLVRRARLEDAHDPRESRRIRSQQIQRQLCQRRR